MNPTTIDSLTERARILKARIAPEEHRAVMMCALLEDMCLAMRQLNAELEAARTTDGTKRALLNFTERKRR